MTTVTNDESRTANFIDVSDFASLEDFKELPIGFLKPRKSKSNIYMANMDEPLCFYMPASEIMELYQDDDRINNIKFILDMDDHAEYIQFFYNLDNIVINMAHQKSVEWFGKEFDKETLARYYSPPYSMTDLDEERDDGLFFLVIMVDKAELLDDVADYRPNSEGRLLVVLEGIRFFKKSFTPLLRLVRIDDIDEVESNSSSGESAGLDFHEELASRKVPVNVSASITVQKVEEKQPKISEDVLRELADVASTVNKKEYEILSQSRPAQQLNTAPIPADSASRMSSKLSVRDIEAMLNEKRKQVQEVSVNAEKASRAAELLKQKALKLEDEVKTYERTLERLSLRK
jgi:hypothetical protein